MFPGLLAYAAAGAVGTAAHYALAATFVLAGVPLVAATSAGFALGATLNYRLARDRVFVARATARSAPRFLVVALAGAVLNAMVVALVAPALGAVAAQLLASASVLVAGFGANARWSFARG